MEDFFISYVKINKSRGGIILTYIIDAEEVHNKLVTNRENLVLIDVRFDLFDKSIGEEAYKESHLPSAYYLHIEKDLSSEMQKHGGNHPLPDVKTLAHKLSEMGVTEDKTVVLYDKGNDMFAPRAWWLLHYLGHNKCYVLDGGFEHWVSKGYPTTADIPSKQHTTFIPHIRTNIKVHIDEVKEKLKNNTSYLIDSRAEERYLGKVEPLYHKAGHIPGAKNYFWEDVLNEDGFWKSVEELQDHFKAFNKQEEIIVSCGSGISACPNFLALKMLGYENVKLYPGSYSDWISYNENEVETKQE